MRNAMASTLLLAMIAAGAVRLDPGVLEPEQPTRSATPYRTRQSGADNSGRAGTPCLFDAERGEVPHCVRKSATGELFIAPQFVKKLSFDAYGLAPVHSLTEGWMYVSREGKVVISGVPAMDSWADSFHDGLVRFMRSGKYGFANRKGQVVIPSVYDGAMPFEKGRASVCKGCQSKCAETECEYHLFVGGDWFQIDSKGRVHTRLHPEN